MHGSAMDGQLVRTSSCPITCIFSVRRSVMRRRFLVSCGNGNRGRAAGFGRFCRGQRPQLQKWARIPVCGNASSLIMFCVRKKATEKNGTMCDNPVRAELVKSSDDWLYFGSIESLEQWP